MRLIKLTLFLLVPLMFGNAKAQTNSLVEFQQQLDKYKGEVVYIDFWASWCGPCRKSLPWLSEVQAKYQPQGLKVLTINMDFRKNLAEEFLLKYQINLPVLYDPKGRIARKFNLKGMPSSILVDREGKIINQHSGFSESKIEQYQNSIEDALK